MPKLFHLPILLLTTALLTACTEETPTTYPVSGEECGPGDPVKGLDAADCAAAVPG